MVQKNSKKIGAALSKAFGQNGSSKQGAAGMRSNGMKAGPDVQIQHQARETKNLGEYDADTGSLSYTPDLKDVMTVQLRKQLIQPEALSLIPETMARKYKIMPMEIKGNILRLAMSDTDDIITLQVIAAFTQMHIDPLSASEQEIGEAIDFNYRAFGEIEEEISRISLPGDKNETQIGDGTLKINDTPIVKALSLIIDEAVKARASDIHLQPQEDKMRLRYRVDGVLSDIVTLPLDTSAPLVSRIKIMANMNIVDHLRPQDGQFSIQPRGRREKIDVRVGIVPTVYGEMAAMRLLDRSSAFVSLDQLGFSPESLAKYREMLGASHGMILVSGPTGSGKTTTLYASIKNLDCDTKNIITIEDPVEYRLKNINQIQVNPKTGLTFAVGLRSILRLDPNVILVGEIRDPDTANIAVQSALTGHLVLSSIHTNDAIGIVSRLIDLGVERFLISSAVTCVVAQRMVRKVCPDCAGMVKVSLMERTAYQKETGCDREEFLYGSGCKSCGYTGYKGRTGIFEILQVSDEMRSMLLDGANAGHLQTQATREGMISLLADGMLKVKENITTPDEVLRVAYSLG